MDIKIKKCGEGLKNINFEGLQAKKSMYKYYPDIVRCAICGPSNCGKTNILLSILTDCKYGLIYKNIYIYSKSLNQNKYVYLYKWIKQINKKLKNKIGLFTFENSDDVISLEDVKENSVMIFDDINTHKIKIIEEYFSRGRHKKISCFYLCQTYSRIPKQMVRDNLNLIILFKGNDKTNLKHVYDDHVGIDMCFEYFRMLCSYCWKNKYDFLVINLEKEINNGKYSHNFNELLTIHT